MRDLEMSGMKTVMDKAELLKAVRDNRDKYVLILREAQKGFLEKRKALLEEELAKDVTKGRPASLSLQLQAPTDHTEAYDSAIAMIQAHVEDTYVLGADDFLNLVRDKWHWKGDFLAKNSIYSGTARELLGG